MSLRPDVSTVRAKFVRTWSTRNLWEMRSRVIFVARSTSEWASG